MRKIYAVLAFSLLIATIGHTAGLKPIEKSTAADLEKSTRIKRDEFKKLTVADSIWVRYRDVRGAWDMSSYVLMAKLPDGGDAPQYSVVVETIRSGKNDWAHWREVLDQDGKSLPLVSKEKKALPQKNGDIALREIIEVNVSREYLEKIKINPIPWKMYGESVEETFTIRTNLIAGFLLKCDKELLPLAKPKTPTRKPISSEGL